MKKVALWCTLLVWYSVKFKKTSAIAGFFVKQILLACSQKGGKQSFVAMLCEVTMRKNVIVNEMVSSTQHGHELMK